MNPASVIASARLLFPAALAASWSCAAWANAGRLGRGASPDVSIGRILAALVICVIVAILAALLLRQRGRGIDLKGLFGRLEMARRAIQVVETRRISQHADISIIRSGGKEYLLLLQAGSAQVLNETELPAPGETELPLCD
jgi:Na+/citrate or Na+/malate symporter